MFTVKQYPQGTFSWVDYSAKKIDASKTFYSELLGWTHKDSPVGDNYLYTTFYKDGHQVAGAGDAPVDAPDMPAAWTSYINVVDADAICAQAQALGGTIISPPMDIMEEGRMALIQDPTGAIVGLWQPKNHIGATLVNTYGAFSWNELATPDVDKAKAFFGALFGWTFQASGNDYTLIQNNGRSNGGIIQMKENWGNVPPHWLVYFTVADIHAAVADAERLGGKTVMPITGSDGMQFAVISDPLGGVFTLIQSERLDPWED